MGSSNALKFSVSFIKRPDSRTLYLARPVDEGNPEDWAALDRAIAECIRSNSILIETDPATASAHAPARVLTLSPGARSMSSIDRADNCRDLAVHLEFHSMPR